MQAFLPPIAAGFLAAFVAYSSTFTVVLQGLTSVGATPDQAASGLLAISLVMGLGGIVYSAVTRIPMNIAWSSPGAAFLVAAGVPEGGFAGAVGAFIVAGLLTLAAGLVRPVATAIARIPSSLASAMLAGILFDLCLAPVRAMVEAPLAAGAIIVSFIAISLWRPLFAVPAATAVTVALVVAALPPGFSFAGPLMATPVLVTPEFHLSAAVGLGVPLFVISMASQNVPGLTILKANGYDPAPGPLFATLGGLGVAAAPFGAHSVILAAITAGLCAGESAGPDRSLRWIAGVVSGLCYIAFGLSAAVLVALTAGSPLLVATVAGLALLGVFAASLKAAMERDGEREAAAIAFLVTASGIAFFGVSAAVWGLLAGGLVLAARRLAGRRFLR
ncbi:benzoate/H(+) symporter BenE family transporter [Aureimonas mangrovi]|uniref:benzoate/H(+) symporter BenE family transporter n=1 Tax=Aureimonas mangrovi TaxID=2758041 RepID=UPI00163D9643|nr:benzoate/H(+) symporter BenE family transporter [Aureimonas mangrovi]